MVGRLHTEYADNDTVVAFHLYFRNTWLDGMFPVALWNQYGTDSQMRTNNYVESWHARFNRIVHGAHPNLYMFTAHIKREECTVSTTLAQLHCGCAPSKRRTKYDAVDRRLKQAHDEYVRGDIDTQLLLRCIRHVMHVSLGPDRLSLGNRQVLNSMWTEHLYQQPMLIWKLDNCCLLLVNYSIAFLQMMLERRVTF